MAGVSSLGCFRTSWRPFARLEPFGLLILVALLFFLPVLGQQMGVDLNIISHLIGTPIEGLLRFIMWLTGNR